MPPILVKYRRLISLALADNAILFTTAALVGHRVQIHMSVDDLNTFFIWQRPSGAIRPVGHFLSEVNGVNFSDIILDSLTKVFVDLDGTSDGLNFSSYIFDVNNTFCFQSRDGNFNLFSIHICRYYLTLHCWC